ncbi:CBN-SMI-1 protein [Caenorhabditis brenneri]|uniref:Gem-associated protein 2 n=1 Tax=Caenorhabditis brenneri TaxID=135651 RepID=G0NBN7_CAEBE|nr:CBN-SMI-1 protein [Caenorhabditis brenneri]
MDQEACLGPDSTDLEDVDADPNAPAMSAAAYFRQMKAERKAAANVVRVSRNERSVSPEAKKKKKQWLESVGYQKEEDVTTKKNISTLVPSEEWRVKRCRQFGEFRAETAAKIATTKPMIIKELRAPQEENWHEILLEKCLPQFQNVVDKFPNHTGTPPSWQMVFAIPKKHLSQLIEYLIDWSEEEGLSRPIREWIYVLLLVIDLPLVQDVISALRTLLKDCRKLRSQLTPDRKSEADEYSLFITIIGNFFGQKDLADV